jgi:hypothetical protein
MKSLRNGSLLFLVFFIATACVNATSVPSVEATERVDDILSSPAPDVLAVFAGTTPCSAQARPLPQIPAKSDCEQMIWNLVLRHDPETGAPTTYRLESAFGLPRANTNDLAGGGTSILMEGQWTITTGIPPDGAATSGRPQQEHGKQNRAGLKKIQVGERSPRVKSRHLSSSQT